MRTSYAFAFAMVLALAWQVVGASPSQASVPHVKLIDQSKGAYSPVTNGLARHSIRLTLEVSNLDLPVEGQEKRLKALCEDWVRALQVRYLDTSASLRGSLNNWDGNEDVWPLGVAEPVSLSFGDRGGNVMPLILWLRFTVVAPRNALLKVSAHSTPVVTFEGELEPLVSEALVRQHLNFDHSLAFGRSFSDATVNASLEAMWLPGLPAGVLSGQMISIAAKAEVHIGRADDVASTPGASPDATQQSPNSMELSVSRVNYVIGGNYSFYGLKARSTAEFAGYEAVVFAHPWEKWADGNRAFFAAEVEVGARGGDTEWSSLTTLAPDRGSLVGRIGLLAEWAPQIGDINRDLGTGFRFFVRGRAWTDYMKDSDGSGSARFRPFLDSELLVNISKESRVFLRWESGYLPPDLGKYINRVSLGIGKAF